MKILIILDPLTTIKIAKDTTYSMMVAASARGHQLTVCTIADLSYQSTAANGQRVTARCQALSFVEGVIDLYKAIRDHNEKFAIAGYPELTAPTLVTRSPARLRAFVAEHGHAIFKLLDGMGGTSIFQARSDDPNLSVIIETMNQFGKVSVMAQKFLPEISAGDKRILLIGGEVVPHALARIPAQGEVRGNMAAGGRPVAQPLSASDRRIAESLAPKLWAKGLFLVGLDVIGESVTEINVTSPTGFQEIARQAGFDVAAMFIDGLEKAVATQ